MQFCPQMQMALTPEIDAQYFQLSNKGKFCQGCKEEFEESQGSTY